MTDSGLRIDRRTAIRVLLAGRGESLVVTGLGSTTWDAASLGDNDRNFYLWGAMGAAAMVGLASRLRDRTGESSSSPATEKC